MNDDQLREYAEACKKMDYAVRDNDPDYWSMGPLYSAWKRVQEATAPIYKRAHAVAAEEMSKVRDLEKLVNLMVCSSCGGLPIPYSTVVTRSGQTWNRCGC